MLLLHSILYNKSLSLHLSRGCRTEENEVGGSGVACTVSPPPSPLVLPQVIRAQVERKISLVLSELAAAEAERGRAESALKSKDKQKKWMKF
jgi:hypothetical protein